MATPVVPRQLAVGKIESFISRDSDDYLRNWPSHLQEYQLGTCRRAAIVWPKLSEGRHHTRCAAVTEQAAKISERHESPPIDRAARRRSRMAPSRRERSLRSCRPSGFWVKAPLRVKASGRRHSRSATASSAGLSATLSRTLTLILTRANVPICWSFCGLS